MKNRLPKLKLHRETVQLLDSDTLGRIPAGALVKSEDIVTGCNPQCTSDACPTITLTESA